MKKKVLSILLAVALLTSMTIMVGAAGVPSDAEIIFNLPTPGIFNPCYPVCNCEDDDGYIPGFNPGSDSMNLRFGAHYISATLRTYDSIDVATVGARGTLDAFWRLDVAMAQFEVDGTRTMEGTELNLVRGTFAGNQMENLNVPEETGFFGPDDSTGGFGDVIFLASGQVDGPVGEIGINFSGELEVPPMDVVEGTATADLLWLFTHSAGTAPTPPPLP